MQVLGRERALHGWTFLRAAQLGGPKQCPWLGSLRGETPGAILPTAAQAG